MSAGRHSPPHVWHDGAMQRTLNLPRWLLWALFFGAVVAQMYGLYAPDMPVQDASIPNFDKIGHFTIFAAVAVTGSWLRFSPWWLGGILVTHAALSEVIQSLLLPHRSGDPWDFATDIIGTAIGLACGIYTARFVAKNK